MTRIATAVSFVIAMFVPAFGSAYAQDRGSLDEAQSMAEAAAAYLQAEGPDVAFPAFNEGDDWHDRDLYVFVLAPDGTFLAHGVAHDKIGENMIDVTDASGTRFIEEIVNVEGMGWVDYQYLNPQTEETEPKRSYVINIDGEYFVGVGAYVQ